MISSSNIAITPCPSAHRRSTSNATMHSGTLWRLLSIEDLDFPSSVHCSLPSSQNWSWQCSMCLFSISSMPSCLKACEPSPEGWDLSREGTLACHVLVAKALSRSWECRAIVACSYLCFQSDKSINGISPLTGHIVYHLMASSGHLLNQLQLSLLQASYKGIESVLPEVMTEISDVIAGAMVMVLHGAHWIQQLCPGHPLALPNPRLKDCFASSELDLRLCTDCAKGQGNHTKIRPQLGLLWTEWCVARIVHSHFKTHWTPTGNCSSILGHLILLLQVSTNRRYFKWRHSALGHSFPRSFPNHIFQNFLFKIARVKNNLPRSSLPCETEAKARLRKSNSTKGVAPLMGRMAAQLQPVDARLMVLMVGFEKCGKHWKTPMWSEVPSESQDTSMGPWAWWMSGKPILKLKEQWWQEIWIVCFWKNHWVRPRMCCIKSIKKQWNFSLKVFLGTIQFLLSFASSYNNFEG